MRGFRRLLELTQDDIAVKTGIDRATISRAERRIIQLSPKQLAQVARVLKVRVRDLQPNNKEQ